jgi:hypothetical protein
MVEARGGAVKAAAGDGQGMRNVEKVSNSDIPFCGYASEYQQPNAHRKACDGLYLY